MGIDRNELGSSSYGSLVLIFDVETSSRVGEPLTKTKIHHVYCVFIRLDSNAEIVRLEVSVQEIYTVDVSDSVELLERWDLRSQTLCKK